MIYRGCLSKIAPIRTRFSLSATNCFFSKVCDKLLAAQASYIDHEEQIVYMVLTDTSTEVDFCINNYLFERGYAKLTDLEGLVDKKLNVSFWFLFVFYLVFNGIADRNNIYDYYTVIVDTPFSIKMWDKNVQPSDSLNISSSFQVF